MKLIYIANARMPTEKAHGYQIAKMCEAFANYDIDLELVVPRKRNNIKENIFSYYDIKKNFKITKLPNWSLPYYSKISLVFQIISFALTTFIYLILKKVDLIYARGEDNLFLLSFLRNNLAWETHSYRNNFLARRLLKKCKGIIVTTNELKKLYIKKDIPEKKILVAPDAVDIENFAIDLSREEARKNFNFPLNKIILGYSGSFRTMGRDKGLNDILKALRILKKENSNILFIAIGGNEKDIEYYKRLANKLGVWGHVNLLPRVNLDKLAVFQKAGDILLMPFPYTEHYAYYMSPLKMFEYMASKRPIIASDLPSIREVLNEKNCVLCQPDDPEDLANKILYLINNQEYGKNLAEQSFKDVQEYTWEKRAKKIIDFIKKDT